MCIASALCETVGDVDRTDTSSDGKADEKEDWAPTSGGTVGEADDTASSSDEVASEVDNVLRKPLRSDLDDSRCRHPSYSINDLRTT